MRCNCCSQIVILKTDCPLMYNLTVLVLLYMLIYSNVVTFAYFTYFIIERHISIIRTP